MKMREIIKFENGVRVEGAVSEARFEVITGVEKEYFKREAEAVFADIDEELRLTAGAYFPEEQREPDCKRFKAVTEEELTKIEEDRQEKTTKKATKWGVRVMKGKLVYKSLKKDEI